MARSQKSLHPHADGDLLPIYGAAEGQEQKKKSAGGEGGDDAGKGEGTTKTAKKGDELKAEMDELIDEIDEVLEQNAEEFVKNYVQRGGQ